MRGGIVSAPRFPTLRALCHYARVINSGHDVTCTFQRDDGESPDAYHVEMVVTNPQAGDRGVYFAGEGDSIEQACEMVAHGIELHRRRLVEMGVEPSRADAADHRAASPPEPLCLERLSAMLPERARELRELSESPALGEPGWAILDRNNFKEAARELEILRQRLVWERENPDSVIPGYRGES